MAVQDAARTAQVWERTVDRVKQTVMHPPLWRALEQTVPVVWDGDDFVVGLRAGGDGQASGQVNAGENRMAMERAAQEVTGAPSLRLRIIDGTDVSDWEYVKKREAVALAKTQQVVTQRVQEAKSASTWDEVYDRASRMWAASEFRGLPTGRARYLSAVLAVLSEAMDTLYPDGDTKPDEQTERGLSRVVDRIASISTTDPVVVAYLLFASRKNAQ